MVPFRASDVGGAFVEGVTSWLGHRQRRTNTVGEVRSIAGSLRQIVDERAAAQFRERQFWIQQAGAIQAPIGIPIEQETDVKLLKLARAPRVTHDVDGAAIAEEMVELRPACYLIDAVEVYQEQFACVLGRSLNVVQKDILVAKIRTHPHDIAFVSDDVDQAELLEERRKRVESLAYLSSRFNRNAHGRRVIEIKSHKRVGDRAGYPVGDVEIQRSQMREQDFT